VTAAGKHDTTRYVTQT